MKSIDTSASCVAYWKKGEHKVLEILHHKESYTEGKLNSQSTFAYEANVTILDSTANSFTIQWTFHLPESLEKSNPHLADSLPVFAGMKMLFKTSEMGAFIELINWEEVRDSYMKMMEISLPKNMDSTAKAALEQSKAMFSTKEMVEASLIKEIQLYHFPFGYTFTTRETEQATQLPNPFASFTEI